MIAVVTDVHYRMSLALIRDLSQAGAEVITVRDVLKGTPHDELVDFASRFLTYELGQGDRIRLHDTFAAAFLLHGFIALVMVLVAETVGLWFLENKVVPHCICEFFGLIISQCIKT